MNILMIGGTGLISTEITNVLATTDHSLTLYNRGERDRDIPAGVDVVTGDRTDYDTFEQQMESQDPDVVIDMYCMRRADAESAVRAFRESIEQYIFCSTVDVYAFPPQELPIPTDGNRREPGTGYAAEKAGCERIFERAAANGAFNLTTLRPWYTYGEGRDILSAVDGTDVIARLKAGRPLIVQDGGETVWGACHRDDVAHAFVNAVGNEAAYGNAYNTCGEEWMTWNQYFGVAADGIGAPTPNLVHIPVDVLRSAFPDRTRNLERTFQYSQCYDTTSARRDLDFEYTISWEEGIQRAAQWLSEHDELDPHPQDSVYDAVCENWSEVEADALEAITNI